MAEDKIRNQGEQNPCGREYEGTSLSGRSALDRYADFEDCFEDERYVALGHLGSEKGEKVTSHLTSVNYPQKDIIQIENGKLESSFPINGVEKNGCQSEGNDLGRSALKRRGLIGIAGLLIAGGFFSGYFAGNLKNTNLEEEYHRGYSQGVNDLKISLTGDEFDLEYSIGVSALAKGTYEEGIRKSLEVLMDLGEISQEDYERLSSAIDKYSSENFTFGDNTNFDNDLKLLLNDQIKEFQSDHRVN